MIIMNLFQADLKLQQNIHIKIAKVSFGTKYSRMDQVTFVEDSL